MKTNVNSGVKSDNDINVCAKRLGRQMKAVLLWLYDRKDKVHQQTEIIKGLYGEVTGSRKASMSRTIKTLMHCGFVASRKAYWSPQFNCWIRQRIHYYLTEKGERHVQTLTSNPHLDAELTFTRRDGEGIGQARGKE